MENIQPYDAHEYYFKIDIKRRQADSKLCGEDEIETFLSRWMEMRNRLH